MHVGRFPKVTFTLSGVNKIQVLFYRATRKGKYYRVSRYKLLVVHQGLLFRNLSCTARCHEWHKCECSGTAILADIPRQNEFSSLDAQQTLEQYSRVGSDTNRFQCEKQVPRWCLSRFRSIVRDLVLHPFVVSVFIVHTSKDIHLFCRT